jgi:hypothetical protein
MNLLFRRPLSKKYGGPGMKFGGRDYTIFDFAGPLNEKRFCTIEESVKRASRICTYSSKGDLLSESPLGVVASHLDVDAAFRRAIVYSYAEDSVTLFDLENGVTILEKSCRALYFVGFVENSPIIQDASGEIWRLDEVTGLSSRVGVSPPILAWATDGSLRAVKDGDRSILITNSNGRTLFSIPCLGLTCFDPDMSIADASKDILLIEPGAGLRLYSTLDQQCQFRLESTEHTSIEYGCIRAKDSEVICLAHDGTTERDSVFYSAKRDHMTEIRRVGFVPAHGHFLEDGTLFASNTGDLINLS